MTFILYIEILGHRRIWAHLETWRAYEVYGQKCGHPQSRTSDEEGYVWSNDNNSLVMVF